MAEISDVRDLFFARLKMFADAQALRIEISGERFKPGDNETWLRFSFKAARPSNPYAGTWRISQEKGFAQIDVFGPEARKQKAFEKIAWDVREAYWPTSAVLAPTLGSTPLVRLGPSAPQVVDHPSPEAGRLGSIVTIYWTSNFPRT